MAPTAIPDDYYAILEVAPTATPETITKSYRRLALLRHPDKNPSSDATKVFQLLNNSYEILMDESKRREYDRTYPQIAKTRLRTTQPTPRKPSTKYFPVRPKTRPAATPQTPPNPPQEPGPTLFTSEPKNEPPSEAKDLSALKAIFIRKQERASRFAKEQKECEDVIREINKRIRQLQNAIRELDIRRKAEEAEKLDEAVNGWSAWLISSFGKKPAETEEEKQQKMRERIERLNTRTSKEKSLQKKELELKDKKKALALLREKFVAANSQDDDIKREVVRGASQQQKRERKAAEDRGKAEDARTKQERERKEKARAKEEAEEKPNSEQTRKDEAKKLREDFQSNSTEPKTPNDYTGSEDTTQSSASASTSRSARGLCSHDGCWLKIEGRMACEYCFNTYNYLLQCPHCKMDACSACQQTLRPW
ncbi:Chaperone protein DnaJ [Lachnellula arida]|uniref:Chaperone protein DnaJ n=1 Tax=Lachnellula arida TaxID=1316785 RepID=A0A8T9BI76_9HELO|nr:Chaperone protein DnaJ [Lachnellula arida]